jgi:tetratricopeptide (TPR) repeat protein
MTTRLLLILFIGLIFNLNAGANTKTAKAFQSANESQLATQIAEINELKKQLSQSADDKRKAEDETRKAEIAALKEQVQVATNNSQKAADWWINAAGIVLTIMGLVVTVIGLVIPWLMTRRQRQDLNILEAQITQHLKKAEALVASISGLETQGKTHVDVLAKLEQAANTDPTKVSPGSAEALTVQNAIANITEEEQERQPIEVRLRLNALGAQAKNKWLNALSFWQQLLELRPNDSIALIGLASTHSALAEQQTSPELRDKHYKFAIENFKLATPKLHGLELAAVQNHLGALLGILGQNEIGTVRLEEAIYYFEEALSVYSREQSPKNWSETQSNLGNTLSILGDREKNKTRLTDAIAAFQEALKERSRDQNPIEWAGVKNNLGLALKALGKLENDPVLLETAVSTFQEVLQECTRDRVPFRWSATKNNLGNALLALGEIENNTEKLEEAIAAYEEALKERDPVLMPLKWAETQYNLGTALSFLGDQKKDIRRLEDAVIVFKSALTVYENFDKTKLTTSIRKNLELTENQIRELTAKRQ